MGRLGLRVITWVTIGASLGVLGRLVYVDYSVKTGFQKLNVSQTRDQVEGALGKPSGHEECGRFGGTVGQEIPSTCVDEYSYLSLLSFADVWTVGFDDKKRVV